MPFLSYSVIPIFKNCETSAQASPLQRKNFAIGVNILIISSLLCSSNKKYIPMGQTIIFDKVSMSKQTANLSGCTLFRTVLAIPISPINTKRKIIFRIHLSIHWQRCQYCIIWKLNCIQFSSEQFDHRWITV